MAAIETAVSGTAIFASSTGNHYIITLDHVEMIRLLETRCIFDNEIDFACSEGWRARESTSSSSIMGIDVVSQSNSVHAGCLFPVSFRTRDRHRDAHIFPFYEIALLFLSLQQALAFMDIGFGR